MAPAVFPGRPLHPCFPPGPAAAGGVSSLRGAGPASRLPESLQAAGRGLPPRTPHPTGLPGSFPKARRSESFPPECSVLLLGSAGRLLARSGRRVVSRGDLVQLAQGGPARRCFARSRNLVGATSDFLCEIPTRVTLPSQRWLTGRPSLVPVVPHHSHREPVLYPRGRAVPVSQGLPRPQNHTGQTLSGAKTATAGRRCRERLIWSTAGPAKRCPGPPSGPPSSTGAPPQCCCRGLVRPRLLRHRPLQPLRCIPWFSVVTRRLCIPTRAGTASLVTAERRQPWALAGPCRKLVRVRSGPSDPGLPAHSPSLPPPAPTFLASPSPA